MSRNEPVPNHSYLYGMHYDWVSGGITVTGASYLAPFTRERRMPINRVNTKRNGRYVPGSNWFAIELTTRHTAEKSVIFRPSYGRAYEGRMWTPPTSWTISKTNWCRNQFNSTNADSWLSDLRSYAPEGFAKARPAQPDFSIVNSLYELREAPRMLSQSLLELLQAIAKRTGTTVSYLLRRKKFRDRGVVSRASENLLAIELGWIPLYNDIKNFLNAYRNLNRSYKALLKHEGRTLIRRRDLLKSNPYIAESRNNYGTPYNNQVRPTFVTQCYSSGGCYTKWREEADDEIYFIGAFRYYLPRGPRTVRWKAKLRRAMMGGVLSPSVVWNMLPWTWFADYFTNLGHLIESYSPTSVAESCHCDWAYVIRKRRNTIIQECTTNVWVAQGKSKTLTIGVKTDLIVKSRARVHPFGTASLNPSLSPRQLAIVAALPLSRTHW